MSKTENKIIINNNIDNSSNGNEPNRQKKDSSLQKWAAWATIVSALIAIYLIFQDDIHELFESDYDPEVEHVVE